MPPKRKGGRHHRKNPTTTPTISAMANCKLPNDIIISILSRLPVKSLIRFKSVCKPWLTQISRPRFIALHLDRSCKNPNNHSLIIHSEDEDADYHIMSLLNLRSTETKPINLLNPYPVLFHKMDFVGSVNGLVCLSYPPMGQMIILWNPALNMSKPIRLPKIDLSGNPEIISVGFGYDSVKDDYKIVRIACLEAKRNKPDQIFVRAEVYSVKSDSWKKIKIKSPFVVSSTRCITTVKGVPYWTAIMCDSERKLNQFFIWYDMENEVFKNVPMPQFHLPMFLMHSDTALLVELNGNLAAVVYSPSFQLRDHIDVLVYDKDEESWKRKSTHGPIGYEMERIVQCSNEGVILGLTPETELFLYDPATNNGVKEIDIPGAKKEKNSFEAFNYTESLVRIDGMEMVKEQDRDKFCVDYDEINDDVRREMREMESGVAWNEAMMKYLSFAPLG